jgi:tetratricopeptide (TPR) repeat protein
MSTERTLLLLIGAVLLLCTPPALAEDAIHYRSRILLDPLGEIGKGREMSVDELEAEIDSIDDPYARSSATRHLARHYVQQEDYAAALDWYREALAAEGLSPVANREMLREMAQVYLLDENYAEAARTLERGLAIDLAPDAADFLLLAQVRYRQTDYVGVVTALDGIQAEGLVLDTQQKRQALALYYRAGAFEQCEPLLRQLQAEFPAEPVYWHQLASVYLQQNKRRQAMDQLVLALEKGIPFTDQEMLLLIDLLAVNGNPYGAAQVLQESMSAGRLPRDATTQRKLFELWLQAREREQAKRALVEAAQLSGETELYLYLAQLQLEDEQWSGVEKTVLTACERQLEDRFVSRANLLLGVSLLKQSREEAARQALINATLVGGANQQAAEWLRFMEARPPTENELRRERGPCYGSRGKKAALREEAPAQAAPSPEAEAVAAGTLEVQSAAAQRFYVSEHDEAVAQLLPRVRKLLVHQYVSLVKSGGTAGGPVQLIADGEGPLRLAIPLRGSVPASGRYKVYKGGEFRYVAFSLSADESDIPAQLAAAVEAVQAEGLELDGPWRLVLAGEEEGQFELQLGVR